MSKWQLKKQKKKSQSELNSISINKKAIYMRL